MRRTIVLTLIALEAAACASTTRLYSGPTRDAKELVHLTVNPSVTRRLVLNGREVSGYSFELEPGPIEVEFVIRRSGYGSISTTTVYGVECTATFEGQAGQRYRIDGGQFRGSESAYLGTKDTPRIPEQGDIENKHVREIQLLLIGWVEHLESRTRTEAICVGTG